MTRFIRRCWEGRQFSFNLQVSFEIGLIAFVCLVYSGCTIRNVSRAPEPPFPMLDQYGQWFELQPYGNVWQPQAAQSWRPFADGRWLWTDRGWYWDSSEPYGWVVYHYGYWVFAGASGWVWIPGYDWSPARVQWFVSDRYIGWSPMVPGHTPPPPSDPAILWIVVPTRTFTFDNVTQYHVRNMPSLRSTGGSATQRPPDVGLIERYAARPVPQLRTETQKVRSGGKSLTQVRITGDQTRGGAGGIPPPPPAEEKNPSPPPRTRESGQTRTAPPGEVPRGTPIEADTTKPENKPPRSREERKPR